MKYNIDFVRENAHLGYDYLMQEHDKLFNTKSTYYGMKNFCHKNKIKVRQWQKGFNGYIYLDLKELYYNNKSYNEICDFMLKKYPNITFTREKITHYCNRHFREKKYSAKKVNKLPIGSEKIYHFKDGRKVIYIKYQDLPTDKKNREYKVNWKPKSVYVYEKYFGKIPKGYYVIFLDGNSLNCDISNLKLVSQSTQTYLSTKKCYGYGKATEAMCEVLETKELLRKSGV